MALQKLTTNSVELSRSHPHKNAHWKRDLLIIRNKDMFHLIPHREIIWCEASNNYTWIHLSHNKKVLASITLRKIIDQLPEEDFMRIHQSYCVQIACIRSFSIKIDAFLSLENDIKLPVSRSRKPSVKQLFNSSYKPFK